MLHTEVSLCPWFLLFGPNGLTHLMNLTILFSGWALKTLDDHAQDPRPYLYSLEELDRAQSHDPIWNAAQCQLVTEGTIHNYLRMLWGKKILEWSPSPRLCAALW